MSDKSKRDREWKEKRLNSVKFFDKRKNDKPGGVKKFSKNVPKKEGEKLTWKETRDSQFCYFCRKPGHTIKKCTEKGKNKVGICFRCGSYEHKLSECQEPNNGVLKYANCFNCNEKGHITAQCPTNKNGIYPKGGGCRVCGENTHLMKDCPLKQKQARGERVEKVKDYEEREETYEGEKEMLKKKKPAVVNFK
ncbi:zinc finger protein containing CCHC type domain [Planoprotostelium fungivorum]|uniref:Zinc finger protein containing CCHC type domain n=1 Tax=Planoprotostelium fungivorum TaxID=1890364 RepID=A0A2P6MPG5_9EUKA|nr:zinc finger protein containing CCHC type domain [Planoprotostelium fungivorum]